jgi:hypothetical protein
MEENTTPTSTHPVLQQLKDKIVELETKLEQQLQASSTKFYEQMATEERLKEILVEGINDSEITNEFAQSIAGLFEIELTEYVEMELTFKVQASFNVPIGTDTDLLAQEVGIETSFHGLAEEYYNSDYYELDDWNVSS